MVLQKLPAGSETALSAFTFVVVVFAQVLFFLASILRNTLSKIMNFEFRECEMSGNWTNWTEFVEEFCASDFWVSLVESMSSFGF